MLRRAILILLAVLLVAAGAVYWFFSGDAMRRALEQQASAWLGQPVRIGSATAQLFPRVAVDLGDVRVGEPARLTLDTVEVSTGLRPLLSRHVDDAEITISGSRIEMPLALPLPESGGEAADAAAGDGGITIGSIRAIRLRDVRIVSRGREIVVSADSSLAGSRLEVSSFTARSGETALDASGVVNLEPRLDATLKASANQLDLDELIALADAFTPPPAASSPQAKSGGGALVPGRLTAEITAERGRAAGVELTNLATTLAAQGDRITLTPASFELFGGRFEGGLELTTGDRLGMSVNARINNLDVAELASFGGVAGSISGRLTGSGKFAGRGADMASVLAAASGSGTATIADGTIQRLNLVRTVVLYFGRPATEAPDSAGDRFRRLAASFTLANQVVRAEALTLESQDVDIAGTGRLTIPSKALDGRAELLLSESLSSQAGTDLVRFTREGDRVVLPATIGGTVSEPRVSIDAAAAVKRGLRNEVERQLKGLFDRLKPPK